MAQTAKQATDTAINQLVESLKAGKSETLTNYLKTCSRFHHYSFGNQLLIATQKPNASRVAGFQTWKKMNRFVNKGEKGIFILAPCVRKVEVENKEEKESKVVGFHGVYVFDVSQTDGEPLPQIGTMNGEVFANGLVDNLKQMVSDCGIELEHSDSIAPARGTSWGGKITIDKGACKTDAEYFSTMVHELAHELLHRTERRSQTTKTIRETEAEAVAFVVSQACGLETGTAAQDYIGLYDGTAETLIESLKFVQETAHKILEVVMPKQSERMAA